MNKNEYTNPATGRSEQITDSRAKGELTMTLYTTSPHDGFCHCQDCRREERIAAAQAEQAAFEKNSWPAKRYGCPCCQCRGR